jgi:squalene cyclase
LSFATFALAQSPAIDNGLSWINSNQNTDGEWGNNPDYYLVDTTEVLNTFRYLDITDISYTDGVAWLIGQTPNSTDYLSRRIRTLYEAGEDISVDIYNLISYQNVDGGWGGDAELTSTIIDSVLVLQTLKKADYSDLNDIGYAIRYLMTAQNADGGYGFIKDDDSNTYVTALALKVLSEYNGTYDLQTEVDNAVTYLLTKQNTDGGFGSSPSTVYETALAFDALVASDADISAIANDAINYLTTTQQANGSWNDDPYSTALALRALAQVRPNLSITADDISFSNITPVEGEMITVSATVRNRGHADADNVAVSFYDGDPDSGGILIDNVIVSIQSNGSEIASVQWDTTSVGNHEIYVLVDPGDFITSYPKWMNRITALRHRSGSINR